MSEFRTNEQYLNEADDIQQKTKDALLRIQRQTAETEQVAESTLDELRKQGEQLDNINEEVTSVNRKLDESSNLQNRFDRWAGNWLGGKKREALKEAAANTAISEQAKSQQIGKGVTNTFENQKYDSFSGKWKFIGLYECLDNGYGGNKLPDLFDPETQHSIPDGKWNIDYSISNVDPDGFTYGNSFEQLDKGSGSSSKNWRTYVRRRKWKYVERINSLGGEVSNVRARQAEREKERLASSQKSALAAKIGFAPRSKIDLKESGFTTISNNGETDDENNLDDESKAGLQRIKQNDLEIDAMLDQTVASLDRISALSNAMGEATIDQKAKADTIDLNMSTAANKQAVVNSRAKRLLR